MIVKILKTVVNNILFKYVEWETQWYKPKNKFKFGDDIELNWKAKVRGYRQATPMTFKSIDMDNVVDTNEGDVWNLYWLKHSDDVYTLNGRIYSKKKIRKQMIDYCKMRKRRDKKFGELQHPSPNDKIVDYKSLTKQ